MLTIPLAFFIVMLELSVGSFLVLYALDIRNDTSFNFVRFQAVLYLLLFTLLTWGTMVGFANADQLRRFGYNLDFHWLSYQGTALLWFMLLQVAYSVSLISRKWRLARLVTGGAASLLGIFCLFAVGMGYRPIAAANLGGALTVLGFFAGALALGGVSTAMLLGHWYLNTPTATGKPLEFATLLTVGGIVAQIAFGILGGGVTYVHPPATHQTSAVVAHTANVAAPALAATPTPGKGSTATPTPPFKQSVQFNTVTLIILEYLLGLGIPLALSVIAFRLERERSFQSATGMLYIAVVFAFFGEVLARNLFLQPLS